LEIKCAFEKKCLHHGSDLELWMLFPVDNQHLLVFGT